MTSKRLLVAASTALLIGAFAAPSLLTRAADTVAAPVAQDSQPASDGVALAIYNQGTALVVDRRTFALDAGVNTLDFTDVAAYIDATSVTFVSLTDPTGTFVLEQNYVFDLVNSGALLQRYLDQRIELVADDGTIFAGQLLSGRNGEVILRDDNGQIIVISLAQVRDIRFPALSDGLITRPTLRWLIESAAAGEQQVQLTYLTGGMNWSADYNVLLARDNTSLDLNGWITLTNTSGATFRDAQVKLIAGDVNRLPDASVMNEMLFADGIAASAAPEARVQQRELFEYNLYEIARPVTVADNETKQVEFVNGTGVPAHTFYVYENSYPYYGGGPYADQYYGGIGMTDVQTYLEFTTDAENGLGADLPAGRIRVYQQDIDDAALLIGENVIDHTPEGEDVEIFLGNAFDLVGERKQTSFQQIANTIIEETYEIRLRNRKEDQTVEIRVPEHLFRWTNWEILTATHSYTQTDNNTVEFRVEVPPDGETVITYTVRYSWF
ncbi:MAG: DUF4139 domain-containing protein [Chloroflexota bacterium]|nr:DUF4139 domain-containing protein [Chloroflexota bacterium]